MDQGTDPGVDIVVPEPFLDGNFAPFLHRDVVFIADVTSKESEFERDSIGILQVDGLGPLMVHHICDC